MPRFGGGYLLYYLLWFGLSYLLANPWLLVGIAIVFILRPVIPDPVVYFRSWAKIRQLRSDVAINTANVVARRDLAMLLLDRGRAREARDVLTAALVRSPKDAELHFLLGRACLGAGDPDAALAALGHALELDPSLGQGDPYLLAGDAHRARGRLEEATHAYEHAADENHSSVVARARLASVLAARGEHELAKLVRDEASRTYDQLPAYLRRAQRGSYVRMKLSALFSG